MNTPAYGDLQDPDYVFRALLGHGMFADKLPPCFTSEGLLDYVVKNQPSGDFKNHAYIEYQATRNTNIPRQLAIPHPEAYYYLCSCIKKNWDRINLHIGQPKTKFNFCHVRMLNDDESIFDMSYNGVERWAKEELILDYSLGCRFIVSADISTCFPSIYAHSIPWAIMGKEWAKIHRCNSWNKKKIRNENCRSNGNQPCMHDADELWPNDLDVISRSIKDGETNGILIGPHSSNLISETILSAIDLALQERGYDRVIRHIDDYQFFARDESEAKDFLRTLSMELKKFELALNAKKTKIISFQEFSPLHWISQLNQFSFPDKEKIGFTTINSYLDHALVLSRESHNFAALNYAIKVVSSKNLSPRARRLSLKKILQMSLDHPYILPLLEDKVFPFADGDFSFMKMFLKHLLERALQNGNSDSLSFVFYYALKYQVEIEGVEMKLETVVNFDDCISSLLAYEYSRSRGMNTSLFVDKVYAILNLPERDQDKFWLFLYEILPASELPEFLKKIKKANVSFIKDVAAEGRSCQRQNSPDSLS